MDEHIFSIRHLFAKPAWIGLALLLTFWPLTAAAQGPEKIILNELTQFELAKGESATALFPGSYHRQYCVAMGAPKIEVYEPPANGALSQDVALYPVPQGRCSGKMRPTYRVIYTPHPGFTGTDRFSLRVTSASYRAGKGYARYRDSFEVTVH